MLLLLFFDNIHLYFKSKTGCGCTCAVRVNSETDSLGGSPTLVPPSSHFYTSRVESISEYSLTTRCNARLVAMDGNTRSFRRRRFSTPRMVAHQPLVLAVLLLPATGGPNSSSQSSRSLATHGCRPSLARNPAYTWTHC